MELRNFYYMNTKLIDDFLSAIVGYSYEEAIQKTSTSNQMASDIAGDIKLLKGSGSQGSSSSYETEKRIRFTNAAKFERLYAYLQEEYQEIKEFDSITPEQFANLKRGDIFAALVTPRFSKMKSLTDIIQLFQVLNKQLTTTGQPLFNPDSEEAIGMSMIAELMNSNTMSCVFSFENGRYPLIGRLDRKHMDCEDSQFEGQFSMLCKVQKKIPEGQEIRLDEILSQFSAPEFKTLVNAFYKNLKNPETIIDRIKGPALQVIPIAIYV